jgi:hypothetical protein
MSGRLLATHSSNPNSKSKAQQPKMWLPISINFKTQLKIK